MELAGNNGASLFLVYGKGWIGSDLCAIMDRQKERFVVAQSRMENRESVVQEIKQVQPSHILLAAGVVGRPNVDWCEDHQTETIRSNVIGVLNVVDVAYLHGIHVTNYATGCIYHYDKERQEGKGRGFTEDDPPNFSGSFYSKSKMMAEELLRSYPNVLTLRLRMPLSSDLLNCPRNLICKLVNYKRVVNINNSMTVLPELLPLSIELARRKRCGIMNFTNPGCMTHSEILDLYRRYIDPDHSWETFTLEEQAKVLKAPRSNAFLDTSELVSEFPSVLPLEQSLIKYVFEPALAKKEEIKQKIKNKQQ